MNKNNTINNTIDWTWEYDRNDVLDRGKTEDLTPIPKDPVDPRLLATVTHDSEHESLLIESGRLDPYHTPVGIYSDEEVRLREVKKPGCTKVQAMGIEYKRGVRPIPSGVC